MYRVGIDRKPVLHHNQSMQADFLILGSGIAGLSLALKLSQIGHVTVLTKREITSGSTGLAQGGIAGVTNPEKDSQEDHFQDTMKAGAFHNNEKAVRLVVENGEKALKDLNTWGIQFDFSLHREGGHTYARIFHVADETGRVVQEILADEVLSNPKITVMENAFAVDLIVHGTQAEGVYFFHEGKDKVCIATNTILATGGAGQIYQKTTNPSVTTGDGMAMAIRAGAKLEDMEFVQFHPTALDMPRDPMFLLSEALRGAGAKIVNEHGEQFVNELAPRDIVARSIFLHQKNGGKAFLDFRHESERTLQKKFPMIFENLLSFGLSLARDCIPITPAAHFFCGGVSTDFYGRTTLKNLFAVGEVACTGLHGANRLASNSLLEGVVFADQIFQYCKNHPLQDVISAPVSGTDGSGKFIPEDSDDVCIRKQIQTLTQEYAGVLRNMKEMETALQELSQLKPKGTETNNLLLVAQTVITSALQRKKSLGCHYVA